MTAAGPSPPTNLAVPDFASAAAYGVAVAQFTPPSSAQLQFQVTCSSCLLFVQVGLGGGRKVTRLMGGQPAACRMPLLIWHASPKL